MNRYWMRLLVFLLASTPVAALQAAYGVVLGSYTQRDIAVRELRELQPAPSPLFISVAEPESGTHYRVIAGPYNRFADATDALTVWRERGLADAWVSQIVVPSQVKAASQDDENSDSNGDAARDDGMNDGVNDDENDGVNDGVNDDMNDETVAVEPTP